jgi:diguanylate cyclase (GGDEF)-like protein/PAS domain S-box-containing protein
MHQLFGYAPDSLRGTPIQNLVSAEDWPLVLRNHQLRLAGQGDDLKYPARMHTRHAGIRWFEVSGVRIQWQDKEATLNYLDDITQRREMEETVQGLAYLDPLTKLPNRRLLMDRLGQAQLSTLRNGTWAAVVFLDLDRFKLLNDIHGHHAGDLLLKEVAQRLVNCVRAIDTVARLGGDEFVVLLTDLGSNSATAQQAAQQVSQKMLAALAQPYQLILDGSCDQMEIEHECSASAGLVLFAGTTPPVETLLEQADAAMYAAKKAGRNQLSFHTVDSQPAHV